jgi:hypothetical protein
MLRVNSHFDTVFLTFVGKENEVAALRSRRQRRLL